MWKAGGESCLLGSQSVPSESQPDAGCRFILGWLIGVGGAAGSGGGSALCFLPDLLGQHHS